MLQKLLNRIVNSMEEAITNSVKELGYIQLKDEQYKIVKMAFDKLEGSSTSIKSIVIVVTPLTAIMKDQV